MFVKQSMCICFPGPDSFTPLQSTGWPTIYPIIQFLKKISIGDGVSDCAPLSCEVPQGSIFGPVLFTLYVFRLGHIMFGCVSYHRHDSVVQLYVFVKSGELPYLSTLHNCINEISALMSHSFLHLNQNKIEALVFAPNQGFGFSNQHLGPLACGTWGSFLNPS